ncbi:hypothetical protein AALP_AA1G183300 [Arabis alpina]|uniref:Agenet domain-containing protein n=1 Tax=Arabis alpina TaxID=50452 RepID=A0A087HP08_ARAAL|nr:hypothetical protein AALP_AA1G183300 [Arabis alpina]
MGQEAIKTMKEVKEVKEGMDMMHKRLSKIEEHLNISEITHPLTVLQTNKTIKMMRFRVNAEEESIREDNDRFPMNLRRPVDRQHLGSCGAVDRQAPWVCRSTGVNRGVDRHLVVAGDGDDVPIHFKDGSDVEIAPSEPKYRWAWYPGKVLNPTRFNRIIKYQVEYNSRFTDKEKTKRMTAHVSADQLRPPPLSLADGGDSFSRKIELMQSVELFENGGWWKGTVNAVKLDDMVSVLMLSSQKTRDVAPNELQIHREWVNGAWDLPEELQRETVDHTSSPHNQNDEVDEDEGSPSHNTSPNHFSSNQDEQNIEQSMDDVDHTSPPLNPNDEVDGGIPIHNMSPNHP